MQQTAQIISKLRNARFQPQGGAKEKLAWINDGEADLLRSIGGSGKRRKFGLPSFAMTASQRQQSNAADKGLRASPKATASKAASSAKTTSNGNTASKPVARPVAVPIPRMKPQIAAVPIPRMKPVTAPVIKPQNYGFVAPAAAPVVRMPAVRSTVPRPMPKPSPVARPVTAGNVEGWDPQFSNPMRFKPVDLRAQYSQYRSPPGDMRLAKPVDTSPQNFGFRGPAPGLAAKQDLRRDISDIHPLGNPAKFSYPRGMAKTLTGVNPKAINMALETQKRFGAPLITTSGLRNPFQNKKAGGAKKSQHMSGNALDFAIPDTQGADTARLLDAMRRSGFTGRGGYRPGKVHGDVRTRETLWGPDTHGSSIGQLPRSMQDALRGMGVYAGMDDY